MKIDFNFEVEMIYIRIITVVAMKQNLIIVVMSQNHNCYRVHLFSLNVDERIIIIT